MQRADEACQKGFEAAGQARQGTDGAGAAGAHAELPAEDRRPHLGVPESLLRPGAHQALEKVTSSTYLSACLPACQVFHCALTLVSY